MTETTTKVVIKFPRVVIVLKNGKIETIKIIKVGVRYMSDTSTSEMEVSALVDLEGLRADIDLALKECQKHQKAL
ncbi:MAG: hypothetical protein WCC64_13460 [Aliidongia sp.]